MRHRAPRQFTNLFRLRRGVAAFLSGRWLAVPKPRALAYVLASALVLVAGGAWASTTLTDDDTAAGRDAPLAAGKLATPPPSRNLDREPLSSPTEDRSDRTEAAKPTSPRDPGSPDTATPTGPASSPVANPSHVLESATTPDVPTSQGESPTDSAQPTDETAPQTTITQGPEAHEADLFVFTASEDSSSFTCSIDGQAFQSCSSPTRYTSLDAGWHTFEVRATDPAGNTDPTPDDWRWHTSGR